jgi:hypothetical protein
MIALELSPRPDSWTNSVTADPCYSMNRHTGEVYGMPGPGDQYLNLSTDDMWSEYIQASVKSCDLNDHGTYSLDQAPRTAADMWTEFYETYPDALARDAKLIDDGVHYVQLPLEDMPGLKGSDSPSSTISLHSSGEQRLGSFNRQYSLLDGGYHQDVSLNDGIGPYGSQVMISDSHGEFQEDLFVASTLPGANGAPFWTGLGFDTKEDFQNNLSLLTASCSMSSLGDI